MIRGYKELEIRDRKRQREREREEERKEEKERERERGYLFVGSTSPKMLLEPRLEPFEFILEPFEFLPQLTFPDVRIGVRVGVMD
jgi:hypothetical protein